MPSMRLSPRRIKSTPTIILYELRMIGLKTRPSSLLRKLEAIIKMWRGLVRWYMQGHTSMRGEVVIHIVGERFGRVNRVDNLVASWRRAIARIVLKKDHQQGGHEGVQQGALHPGNHQGGQVGASTNCKRHVLSKHDLSKLKRATWIAMAPPTFTWTSRSCTRILMWPRQKCGQKWRAPLTPQCARTRSPPCP